MPGSNFCSTGFKGPALKVVAYFNQFKETKLCGRFLYGFYMVLYVFHMVFTWFVYGFIGFLYGFYMVFIWCLYGFYMVFIWFLFGFYMVLYGFNRLIT